MLVVTQVISPLGIQLKLDQLFEEAFGTDHVFRLLAVDQARNQQLVDDDVFCLANEPITQKSETLVLITPHEPA